jgi:hypothetical protein
MTQTEVEMLTEEDVSLHCNAGECVHFLVSLLHPQIDGVTNDYMQTEIRT